MCYIAEKMAESFGRVLYFVPWTNNGHPTAATRAVGVGIPGVTRVYSWLNHLSEADVIMFPSVYNWDECQFVRDMGLPTWGAGAAEALETDRWRTRELMAEIGMPVVPSKLVIGTVALREYIADKTDLYIKCSVTRGDFETRKMVNAHQIEPWIVKLEQKLGPLKDEFEFIVEEKIDGIETGYEIKDCGYVAKVSTFDGLPGKIRDTNIAAARAIEAFGMRGFFSNEIRVADDGTPYLIDWTMRCGWPPSAMSMELFPNWAQVIYSGARGRFVDLEPIAPYGAEIILTSTWVKDEPLAVEIPRENRPWIKLGTYCMIDDKPHVFPDHDDPKFGSAVGVGETLKEACEMAVKNAEAISGLDIDYRHDVFDAAQEEIEKGREHGIEF
jgi:hypothetical protein